jgi:OOP family OmpA-OmpF porin
MSATGLCWHSAYGPAPLWTAGCHSEAVSVGQYAAPVAQPAVLVAPVATAAATPPAVYEKVAFDADVLFESNRSAVSPAGRDMLDAFIEKIAGLESRSVMAIGYADRMGSEASNQVLSEERVSAVKSYLVGKGVEPSRVQTQAWGETRPSIAAAACKDTNTANNVACMQPDRHVFVEISGSRLAT